MNKKYIYLALGLGAGAGLFAGAYLKHKEKKKLEQALRPEAAVSKRTNYQDSDHLIFCPESKLNERFLPLASTVNMRDLGGYTGSHGKTKWNKLFRSEELCHLSDTDKKRLDSYHIDYIIDFRDEGKTKRMPDYLPEGAAYINLPILKGMQRDGHQMDFNDPNAIKNFFKNLYLFVVREKAEEFAKVLKILADEPDAKILFHCTNGKDRTGFMALLLLMLAGVDETTILSDYTLTNLNIDRAYDILGTILEDDLGRDNPSAHEADLYDFFGVDPLWLKSQYDYIVNQFGDIDAYLLENTSLTKEDLKKIRENILE